MYTQEPIKTMKMVIKILAANQRILKKERKETFEGVRNLPPREAQTTHAHNRIRLLHLHLAYAIMRGKEPVYPKIEHKFRQYALDRVLESYSAMPPVNS